MATFSTKKTLYGSTSLIPTIATRIQDEFQKEGYEVEKIFLSNGGYEISITKGGIFKAVLGMRTALKVTLTPQGGSIYFEAGVGVWGQQVIPTIISMLYFWPILITQIWGLVEQSNLDEKALNIAMEVISSNNMSNDNLDSNKGKFCTVCGAQNVETAKFCCGCGKPL